MRGITLGRSKVGKVAVILIVFTIFLCRCYWLHWSRRSSCEQWQTFCTRRRPMQNMLLCGWHGPAMHVSAVLSTVMPKVGTSTESVLQISMSRLATVWWWCQ